MQSASVSITSTHTAPPEPNASKAPSRGRVDPSRPATTSLLKHPPGLHARRATMSNGSELPRVTPRCCTTTCLFLQGTLWVPGLFSRVHEKASYYRPQQVTAIGYQNTPLHWKPIEQVNARGGEDEPYQDQPRYQGRIVGADHGKYSADQRQTLEEPRRYHEH